MYDSDTDSFHWNKNLQAFGVLKKDLDGGWKNSSGKFQVFIQFSYFFQVWKTGMVFSLEFQNFNALFKSCDNYNEYDR